MAQAEQLSSRRRLEFLLLAWVGTAMASMIPYGPRIVAYIWLFPLGLEQLVPQRGSTEKQAVYPALIIGWVFYAILSSGVFLQKRRRRYFLMYSVLCLILAVNVTGCHLMISGIRIDG